MVIISCRDRHEDTLGHTYVDVIKILTLVLNEDLTSIYYAIHKSSYADMYGSMKGTFQEPSNDLFNSAYLRCKNKISP